MPTEPWQGWSICIANVQVYDKEDERGCEGMVLYELTKPCNPGCTAEHSPPDERWGEASRALPLHTEFRYLSQPFHSGGQRHYKGATAEEITENRANVWAWNGNKEAPTLTPSYYFLGRNDPKKRYPDWPAVHIFVTNGRIVDSGCDARIA